MANMRSGNSNQPINENKKSYFFIIAAIVLVIFIIGFVVVMDGRNAALRTMPATQTSTTTGSVLPANPSDATNQSTSAGNS